MAIYTGRINYSGNMTKIDITAKSASGIGKYFKPTWDMVMGYKNGKYGKKEYTSKYLDILEANYYQILQLLQYIKDKDVVFVCYCRTGDFCHRVLLAEYLRDTFKVNYEGEV